MKTRLVLFVMLCAWLCSMACGGEYVLTSYTYDDDDGGVYYESGNGDVTITKSGGDGYLSACVTAEGKADGTNIAWGKIAPSVTYHWDWEGYPDNETDPPPTSSYGYLKYKMTNVSVETRSIIFWFPNNTYESSGEADAWASGDCTYGYSYATSETSGDGSATSTIVSDQGSGDDGGWWWDWMGGCYPESSERTGTGSADAACYTDGDRDSDWQYKNNMYGESFEFTFTLEVEAYTVSDIYGNGDSAHADASMDFEIEFFVYP